MTSPVEATRIRPVPDPAGPARRPGVGSPASAAVAASAPGPVSLPGPGRPALPPSVLATLLPGLQRSAGNRSAGALVPRLVLQRDDDDTPEDGVPPNPYAEEDEQESEAAEARLAEARAALTMDNPRFSGIARLVDLLHGGEPLSRRDNGVPVEAVQVALLDAGYALLQYQHDGRWGAETEAAIGLFRTDQGIGGSGGMDADAMAELDEAAPPPGEVRQHAVDYDRLFADDRLDVALAIGYDERGAHERKLERAHTYLADRGFTRSDPDGSTDPVEHWQVTRELTYPTGSGERTTRQITVVVQVITPGTGSAARFGTALSEAELTLYTGHARRGIGPDFDRDRSPAENFIIGVGSALHDAGRAVEPSRVEQHHYVTDRVNDLEAMAAERDPLTDQPTFDQDRYRVWFFNACTTLAYMDELRGGLLPEGADRRNLDLFGTRATVPTEAGMDTTFALLDGVMRADSMEQIVATMGRISAEIAEREGFSRRQVQQIRDAYWREGAVDNPEAPPAGEAATPVPAGSAP